jgi:hypothetical protein
VKAWATGIWLESARLPVAGPSADSGTRFPSPAALHVNQLEMGSGGCGESIEISGLRSEDQITIHGE